MTAMTPRVVLVGAPGSGKTTVGRLLATRLSVAFRDTDVDIEHAAGMSISDIFVTQGEPTFRQMEHDAVIAALDTHDGVLALGGGAVVDPRTRAALDGHRVVWLQVGLADAASRVGLNRDRPLLLGNVRGTLKRLMDERAPMYDEVASLRVLTDGRSPEEIVEEIVATMEVSA